MKKSQNIMKMIAENVIEKCKYAEKVVFRALKTNFAFWTIIFLKSQ